MEIIFLESSFTVLKYGRNTQQWPQDWKRSVFIPIPKKGNAKEYSNYLTVTLISQANKVILLCSKSFKLGFNST